jgi:hypothetical protein
MAIDKETRQQEIEDFFAFASDVEIKNLWMQRAFRKKVKF